MKKTIVILFLLLISNTLFAQNKIEEKPVKIALNDVLSKIPGKNGERFAVGMRNGTMRLLAYAPRGKDDQQPHKQDEVYLVISGKGTFVCGDKKVEFAPNDVLFVPAGVKHFFENFTDDLVTWVVFYGAEGGEK
jgi:mannose-6-phosphate isomerase-like protein (cupin superfamily)